jgi:cell division protein FtsI (penicillin-binding protein 3)
MHLASAYAALVNGGVLRPATLLRRNGQVPEGRRVISETTSARMRQMMRIVVLKGTGRKADVPGYRVGGKTGTADLAVAGGYNRNARNSVLAAVFPMDHPRYVIVAMLQNPKGTKDTYGHAEAAWTIGPVINHVVARTGPMLGVIPDETKDIDVSDLLPLLWEPKKDAPANDPE